MHHIHQIPAMTMAMPRQPIRCWSLHHYPSAIIMGAIMVIVAVILMDIIMVSAVAIMAVTVVAVMAVIVVDIMAVTVVVTKNLRTGAKDYAHGNDLIC